MFLKHFDLFGSPVNLLINKETVIKTKEGALFTIFVIVCCAISTWLLGNDIIYKEKPSSYSENIVLDHYAAIDWNKEKIPIAFAIQDWNGVNIDYEKYLNLSLIKYRYKTDEKGEMKIKETQYFNLVKCNYSDFPNLKPHMFDSLGLHNALCPGDFNVTLMGFWSEAEFSFLELIIETCMGQKECEGVDGINNFIIKNKANLQLYYQDSLVIVNNYNDPVVKKMNSPYNFLKVGTMKNVNYFIEQDFLHTDDAFFGVSNNQISYLSIKNHISDSTDFNPEDGRLLVVDFYSFNMSNHTFRKYVKITEISANVGGIIKFLTMFSFIFHNYYSDVEKKILIMESLFKETNHNLCRKLVKRSNSEINNLKIDKTNNDIQNILINNYTTRRMGFPRLNYSNKLRTVKNIVQNRLSLGSANNSKKTITIPMKDYQLLTAINCCLRSRIVWIKKLCCKSKHKLIKTYQKIEMRINKALDIVQIITKLQFLTNLKIG